MTLKDIAAEAGVSSVTVSNVINGNLKKVSSETVDRVKSIIEKYNYKPNATARSLAKKESRIIAVIVPNIGVDQNFLQSPYNAELLGVLEKEIRQRGYYMMVRCVVSCMEIIPLFTTWNVDGVIIVGAFSNEAREISCKIKTPMIFIDTYCQEVPIANVGSNDYKGGYLGMKYLIARGHRNIAFAGPSVTSQGVIQERFRGANDALKEKSLAINEDIIYEATTTYEEGVTLGRKIAFSDKDITAVISMSDILALGIMEGLRLSGKMVPEDISVIGYDNLSECRYSVPQLTTVSQNIIEKAELTAHYLFQMINTRSELIINEMTDVEIIERQSVRNLI